MPWLQAYDQSGSLADKLMSEIEINMDANRISADEVFERAFA